MGVQLTYITIQDRQTMKKTRIFHRININYCDPSQEYQSLRKQLLAHHRLLRQQKSAAAAAAKKSRYSSSSQKDKDKEKEKEQQSQEDLLKPLDPDPALSSLPQSLCQNVARGLVHYIIVLTSGDSWDFLPVACKVCACLSLAHNNVYM